MIYANLSSILAAAVDDEPIAANPCRARTVRVPRPDAHEVEPWSREQVLAVHAELPEPYRVAVTLAAGCGLRQGEVFGLAVDDVEFLRGQVNIRRQVKIVGAQLVFALPKGRKTRKVPLPSSVALELAAHLAAHPAIEVTLPWETPDGPPVTAQLIQTSRERRALNRNYVNAHLWKPALRSSGMPTMRENGMHALRHYWASVLLDAGETIRALSENLGHADPGFTLRVYTHLMRTSEERTRGAVDRVLGVTGSAADVPTTSPAALSALS